MWNAASNRGLSQVTNIDDEFATIDVVLASNAETRGVDAFALALIKAERQMRKLFTYLVYQSDAFGPGNVLALRNALADRRLYFRDFVAGWHKLYAKPLNNVVGPDHDRLRVVLDEAIGYRNKIFHGQITTKYLSREDLIVLVTQITCWCRVLAARSEAEIGYDGFGRNSFRKSAVSLKAGLVATIKNVQDHDQLLAEMERQHKMKSK